MISGVVFLQLIQTCFAFYQDEYRVINERCDFVEYNHSYFDNITFALSLYNRTTRAFNFRAHLLIDSTNDVRSVGHYYKFASNEYRLFPMTIPLNICKELESPKFGLDDIKKHSNVATCPFKKGWYYIRNYVPDYTKFPPHIPYGRYKAEMKVYHNYDFVLELHWYAKIEEIIKWN